MIKLSFNAFIFILLGYCVSIGLAEESAIGMTMLSQLPHQAGICDLIFAGTTIEGTIVSNNEECAADFVVDDVLFGSTNSSNITVRSLSRKYTDYIYQFAFAPNERYLVCAFTNNWWGNQGWGDTYFQRLSHGLSITSSPPGNAVFDSYRTMYPPFTVIPFRQINFEGSNYWPVTRALVTNLVDIVRIRGDEDLLRQTITNLVGGGWAKSHLPPVIWDSLLWYKEDRYDWFENFPKQPPQTPFPNLQEGLPLLR
ncbi:MAG: hypothetical protein IJQ73_12935 [Kiritimatiellae bacterium]|nr:hypothetical protein [Kiritimatiellia bacterium]